MRREIVDAILAYVDASIELAMVQHDRDQHEGEWTGLPEKQALAAARQKIESLLSNPFPLRPRFGMVLDLKANRAERIENGQTVEIVENFLS